MAKTEPNQAPEPNRGQKFLEPYRLKWREHFNRAKDAADMTGLPAWTSNYEAQVTRHKQIVKHNLSQMESTIESVRDGELSEDHEKRIKEAVKALGEHRARYQAWVDLAVTPMRSAVDECERIRTAALRAAQESESDAPLTDRGLLAEVEGELSLWPKPAWNDEHGMVEIN